MGWESNLEITYYNCVWLCTFSIFSNLGEIGPNQKSSLKALRGERFEKKIGKTDQFAVWLFLHKKFFIGFIRKTVFRNQVIWTIKWLAGYVLSGIKESIGKHKWSNSTNISLISQQVVVLYTSAGCTLLGI